MKPVNTVAIIGTGVIGASWTAFYLHKGFQVNAFDPAPDAESNLKNRVQIYLQDLFELEGDKNRASESYISELLTNLNFYQNLADAVRDVDFIQENGPERIDLKQELYTQLTEYCPQDTIIASSSSGLKISDIQKNCSYPERR